jgi:putative redox protein
MAKRTAVVRQLRGITLAAKSDSNHWVMMDGRDEFGGSGGAPSPKELLLMSLGGCTAMDVIPILKKKRVTLDGFEINLTANTREEHPQVYTDIHVEYVFYGDAIEKSDVERAIELSVKKYCSVSAMLGTSVNLTHSYRIETLPAPRPVPSLAGPEAAQ